MDDRIYPGVLEINNRILGVTKKYLDISKEDIDSRKSDVVAWRNLVLVLVQKYNKKMSLKDVASIIDRDHSLAVRANKLYRPKFEGDGLFAHYMYMNCIAAIDSKKYFSIKYFMLKSINKFPVGERERKKGAEMINGETPSYPYNQVVHAFILFFQKEGVSRREILKMLNLQKNVDLSYSDLNDKQVYMEIMKSTINQVLYDLKQTK